MTKPAFHRIFIYYRSDFCGDTHCVFHISFHSSPKFIIYCGRRYTIYKDADTKYKEYKIKFQINISMKHTIKLNKCIF